MIKIGLTGSIGMGKSTTAKFFADEGIPVNDSDAVVHQLYACEAAPLIEAEFPGVVTGGVVDRQELSRQLAGQPEGFKRLESIVHPLVRQYERAFLRRHEDSGADMVVLDIPLLFETRADNRVDVIVVVSADPKIQRERVLARAGMTEEKFDMILPRQMPDAEKREKADYVIDTGRGMEAAMRQVRGIIAAIRQRQKQEDPNDA